MDDTISSTTAMQQNDEEATLEQIFAEMDRLNALMREDQVEMDRMKAESALLKQEMQSLRLASQKALARLKAAVHTYGSRL